MSAALRIGVAGLGHVGANVVRLLQQHAADLTQKTGRAVTVTAVSARDAKKQRGFDNAGITFHANPLDLVRDANVDVVVELIGGADGIAKDLVLAAIDAKKPVVTANKALLARHASTLLAKNPVLLFEAAVAGGIPVIKSLREGLAANDIQAVYGILNGTCNFILSEMTATGRDFADVLAEAQKLGYAEADPSFDVDGFDAAHKLSLLSALAFGVMPDVDAIRVQGIRAISALDIGFARELGYRLRLLGIARKREGGQVEQSVEPCLVPATSPVATVEGPLNAVYIDGDFSGKILLTGAGAGGAATASAVVADIVDLARGHALPLLGRTGAIAALKAAPIGKRQGNFYLRVVVLDQPGVIADISAILRDCAVSLESVLQRGRDPNQPVSVILTTHDTAQESMEKAVEKIAALKSVIEPPHLMRIENFA